MITNYYIISLNIFAVIIIIKAIILIEMALVEKALVLWRTPVSCSGLKACFP